MQPSLAHRIAAHLLNLLPQKPPVVGVRRVPGLRADVEIQWTSGGIPHLTASNESDLFFAQGWLCASERLFQMELARRTARGELSEIFGATPPSWPILDGTMRGQSLVDIDLFLRQLSFAESGRAGLESTSPGARTLIDAYAAGVTAWIETGARPLEHQLLGIDSRPWTAADSAAVWKLTGFQLSAGWRAGLVAESIRAKFFDDPGKARALLPDQRAETETVLPTWDAASLLERGQSILGGATTPGVGGSNAWALSGERTKSGRALLCGDLHLPLRAPTQGWISHLSGGGFNVAGWCVPGIPGVVAGHNEELAWSVTSAQTMDAQWALERLGQDRESVRTATGFVPLDSENTEIFVRGAKSPVRARLRHSANGPIVEGPLTSMVPEGHVLALRWAGHLPTADLEAVLDLNRAYDEAAVGRACARLGTPALNVVWADRRGQVGWRFAGALPRFRKRPTLGAVPGWTPQDEWEGVDSAEDVPALSHPEDGLVISANQKIIPDGGPLHLGDLFDSPYRVRRIRERLDATPKATLSGMLDVQLDRFSGFGESMQQRFLSGFSQRLQTPPSGAAGDVLALALSWNRMATPESAGAAALWALTVKLARALLEPALGEALYETLCDQHDLMFAPLLQILERRGAPFVAAEALDALTLSALDEAAQSLRSACGGGVATWRLSALRASTFSHPLSERTGLGTLFRLGPISGGGDGSTVNRAVTRLDERGEIAIGSVFRHGVEAGDWDAYRVILSTGQSGDPTSGRYREHFDRFRKGESFVLPFTPSVVNDATLYRAKLVRE